MVEDDDTLAGLLARGLRAQAYAVDHVRDGDAAVTEASITPYDAIVLDVSLPRREGLFDFLDRETWADAFASPAGAGASSPCRLRPPAIVGVDAITPAVDAAIEGGVSRVVFLSIQGAARNPLVPHHAIERYVERMAEVRGDRSITFLRAVFLMQNFSTTHAADVREHSEVLVPAGMGRTAFVDARDVAAAAAQSLTQSERASHAVAAFELTGRDALTYLEVAEIMTRALGRSIAYHSPGVVRFYRSMRARGYARAHVAVTLALYTTARVGLAADLSDDLEHLLGRPPISLEQFVDEHLAVWK